MEVNQDYIKGFNEGYLIKKHKPELALSLSQVKFPESEHHFASGLKAGIMQRQMEIVKEKNNVKDKERLTKDHDFERGR